MKKYILIFGLFLFLSPVNADEEVLPISTDLAQEEITSPTRKSLEEEKIIPLMTIESYTPVEEETRFDASGTKLISPSFGQANYAWDFGDESPIAWGENVSHTYKKPGLYTVKLKVSQGRRNQSIIQEIIVYDRKGVLITDNIDNAKEIIYQAGVNGIQLKTITHKSSTGFSGEDDFLRRIQENIPFLSESEIIIFHTTSTTAFQSFGQLWQKISEETRFNVEEKLWVQLLSDGSLEKTQKLLQPIFKILNPQFILLTRPTSFDILFQNTETAQKLKIIEQRQIENIIIDERSATSKILFLSNLTSYFVTNGISQNVIYLLLAVPFIAFSIAFCRQFIGISTFGVYTPLMLSLSFLVLGFNFGISVFLAVMFVSYIIRVIFERVDLLYIPKISLLFSFLAISFFLVLGIAVYLETPINLTLTIFPMLMMVSLSEKFIATQSNSGIKKAFISTTETIIVGLIAYLLVTWEWIQNTILALPEIVIIPIIGIIWLGTFTGLRISEYFKFKTLFKDDSQEE